MVFIMELVLRFGAPMVGLGCITGKNRTFLFAFMVVLITTISFLRNVALNYLPLVVYLVVFNSMAGFIN